MVKVGKVLIAYALSATLLSGCSAVSKNSKEVITLVESEDYKQAEKRLEELTENEKLSADEKKEVRSKIQKEISTEIESLIENFKNDEVSVKEVNKNFNGYDSLRLSGVSEKVDKAKETLKELIVSREAFVKGEKFVKDKKYDYAIDEFLKVIKDDVKYEKAQEYISDTKSKLLEQVKVEAIKKKESGMVKIALEDLKKHEKYLKENDSFNTMIDEYGELYYVESMKNINGYRTNKEYDNAIKELETLKTLIEPTEEIGNLLTEIKGEQEKQKRERREQLLANMSSNYDSMDDLTRIAPRGVNPFVLDIPQGGFIFFPIIQFSGKNMDSGISAISIATGFSQDDWIFMDRISFNVDGERFSWELSFGEADSQVGWGSIYEWVLMNSILKTNLKNDLKKIANAGSVTIRFDGDTNSRDETLSKQQIQQIKDALELYESINKYGL
ncbi:hypothetical protein [Neobacillus vireti]|uniref:hypothetical protein n=1 Tax=Neobacillus vireti TaxID=220686 RepID=UPI002FFF983C